MIKTVTLNSLAKVFPNGGFENYESREFTALKNEPLSFQVAYRLEDEKLSVLPFYIRVESELPLTFYSVGYVPVLNAGKPNFSEKYNSVLFPDMLLPKAVNPEIVKNLHANCGLNLFFEKGEKTELYASRDSFKSLWFTVNEYGNNIPAGEYTVNFKMFERYNNSNNQSNEVGSFSVKIKIINAVLPKQKLLCTNWFHCDCLADAHNVKIFSDEFFEIFESYVDAAVKNGMNMILLPAFTPALDTPIGGERATAQLVKITYKNGEYGFDFSLMKRYTDICRKHGMEYFEHCHLFTQWGAKATPKIMAQTEKGEERIFGWDVSATDPRYAEFLKAYVGELKIFLENEGLSNKILFHVSDEPQERIIEDYRKAKAVVKDLLKDYMNGDALSEYVFYEDGTVETPIVSTHKIHEFIGRCDDMWCYYIGTIQNKFSNRLINNSSERNRMIGVQMYYNNIKGYLHWGYNNYYDTLSNGFFDPKINPEGFEGDAGASFLVYPGNDGTAIQSIRQKVLYEGINDVRALELLESLCGREKALEIIEKHYGRVTFETEAESAEKLLALRAEINETIEAAVK